MSTPSDHDLWPLWRKVRLELAERGLSKAEFSRRIGEKERTTLSWLKGEARVPANAASKMAAELGWPVAYLLDESLPYPPEITEDVAARAFEALTPEAWRVVSALSDPAAVAFLAKALDQYEELKQQLGK